ncbi:hypothetical protein, conserved [Leishmania tarentolae]|uniref:Uncharacterized protein n=1 Tax=Leishmania tarentolae TaxID=5689 RepID=A0A640KVW9_LEITA|nr:hypothetical protein, conserved [Leishmania tarentolae]
MNCSLLTLAPCQWITSHRSLPTPPHRHFSSASSFLLSPARLCTTTIRKISVKREGGCAIHVAAHTCANAQPGSPPPPHPTCRVCGHQYYTQAMLTFSRLVAGQHAKQRLPRSLRGLPTPNVRHGWGNLKSLSNEEKRELLHGAWREAAPIQLVPDPSSRDSCPASEPITFSTEEAADRYLAEEEKDEMAEMHESTLALAQRFFVELAAAADEEVDGTHMPPAAPQSDEERRREMRDVQRAFFGDFYVEQGIIDKSERYAFVDTMLRPSRPLFLVNSALPLTRLTVRDQLEAHSTVSTSLDSGIVISGAAGVTGTPSPLPVFTPTAFDPCLYAVPLPPTQTFGAPLHVCFSPSKSRLQSLVSNTGDTTPVIQDGCASTLPISKEELSAMGDQAVLPLTAESVDLIDDADALHAMMLDAPSHVGAHPLQVPAASLPASLTKEEGGPAAASAGIAASALSVGGPALSPPTQPPSLAHMYWLQRQVASSTLFHVDDLSLAVSLLSVRLAAAAVSIEEGVPHPYEVVLCQANDRDETGCTYHTEIVQYLFRAAQVESSDPAAAARLARVVIAVEEASCTDHSATPRHQVRARMHKDSRLQHRQTCVPSLACDESAVAVMDRSPNMVYLEPPSPNGRRRRLASPRCSLADSGSEATAARPFSRVVVCIPETSRDGVRPRGWLAGEQEEAPDEDADPAPLGGHTSSSPHHHGSPSFVSGAPPNTFVERCQRASANFSKLQKQLYTAIQSVRVDGCGWVIYATQSANVIENEAVVCAVLQRILMKSDELQLRLPQNSSRVEGEEANEGAAAAGHVRQPLSVECVPLDSPTIEACMASAEATSVLQLLFREGRSGLSTWVAIEGGSAGQEAEQYSLDLRTSVARAAWRTDPMRTGSDGGFMVCLRVMSASQVREHERGGSGEAAGSASPLPCCWWTHPDSHVVSALTPATLQFVQDVERADAHRRGHASDAPSRILHAGVPVGYAPLFPAVPASESDVSAAAPALPANFRISSAACHVDVLVTLRHLLPHLTLSAKTFCELLLVKHVQSHVLRRQLRLLQKQSTVQQRQKPGAEDWATDTETETRNFLTAVEKVAQSHFLFSASSSPKRSGRLYVWVGVAAESLLPSTRIISADQETGSAAERPATAGAALHPAVVAELEAAGIVAEVEYWRHISLRDPASSAMDFAVRLDVPPDMPERFKHLAALEEWRLALRDALLYVRRRTCNDRGPVRLWANPSVENADAPEPRVGDSDGANALSVPRTDKVLELTEDEYETLHPADSVPAGGATHSYNLWDCPTLPSMEAEDERADWLRDTNYQRWRRSRAQR